MKVLFLSAANSTHTVRWVNSLSERGIEILLVYNKGHEPREDALSNKVKKHCLKYSGTAGYYLNAWELRKVFKDYDPDFVHAHYASGYGTLVRVAKISPSILSVWGSDVYDFPYESRIKNIILKKNVRHADVLASTSECMASELRKVMGDDKLDIYITPFGVDIEKFSPDNYTIRKDENELVISNIKMLKPIYGIREIILAVDLLLHDQEFIEKCEKKIRLKIFGEGEQREELEKLVEEKNLSHNITFCGKIPNSQVPKELSRSDVFCAFSRKESFGVAVVEAMAMEIPVVVSDADGFKEVVEDSVTGFIVSRQDVDGCKNALKKLLLDDDLRKKMGSAGRKRVKTLYDWEKNVDIMEEIYFQMTGK